MKAGNHADQRAKPRPRREGQQRSKQRGAKRHPREHSPRPEAIRHPAARDHEQRVGDQERRVHRAHPDFRDTELPHNAGTSDGENRPIESSSLRSDRTSGR